MLFFRDFRGRSLSQQADQHDCPFCPWRGADLGSRVIADKITPFLGQPLLGIYKPGVRVHWEHHWLPRPNKKAFERNPKEIREALKKVEYWTYFFGPEESMQRYKEERVNLLRMANQLGIVAK
jgi:hypothetical protein